MLNTIHLFEISKNLSYTPTLIGTRWYSNAPISNIKHLYTSAVNAKYKSAEYGTLLSNTMAVTSVPVVLLN